MWRNSRFSALWLASPSESFCKFHSWAYQVNLALLKATMCAPFLLQRVRQWRICVQSMVWVAGGLSPSCGCLAVCCHSVSSDEKRWCIESLHLHCQVMHRRMKSNTACGGECPHHHESHLNLAFILISKQIYFLCNSLLLLLVTSLIYK